ncbi:MAG: hypothetical protein ABSA17_07805 [Rhabdochlamydiaceae bacterium]|jgi:hypothetical protein
MSANERMSAVAGSRIGMLIGRFSGHIKIALQYKPADSAVDKELYHLLFIGNSTWGREAHFIAQPLP